MDQEKEKSKYYCSECKQPITHGEFKYSTRNFDVPLCRDCQPVIEKTESAPPQKWQLNKTSCIEICEKDPKKNLVKQLS
jgi:NAD-dependent SIR2 family protein deacetylase